MSFVALHRKVHEPTAPCPLMSPANTALYQIPHSSPRCMPEHSPPAICACTCAREWPSCTGRRSPSASGSGRLNAARAPFRMRGGWSWKMWSWLSDFAPRIQNDGLIYALLGNKWQVNLSRSSLEQQKDRKVPGNWHQCDLVSTFKQPFGHLPAKSNHLGDLGRGRISGSSSCRFCVPFRGILFQSCR